MTVLSTLHQTYWGFTRRSIIQGCDDPGHQYYYRIGARGINIYEPWRNNLRVFHDNVVAEIGDRPSSRHGLSRIDETRDFQPGNMIWRTSRERAAVQRLKASLAEPA